MHLRVFRVSGRRPARLALLALAAALLGGCDVDSPGRLTTNRRTASLGFDPARIPAGSVTLEGSLDRISVAIDRLPVLAGPTGPAEGFAYEGWVTTPDSVKSTGRFRLGTQSQDPEAEIGSVRFSYDRSGALTVASGGTALAQGQALADTFDFTAQVGFLLTIEADPENNPGLGFVRLLMTPPDSLLSTSRPLDLILPVNIGTPSQGSFAALDAVATLNAATGEYSLVFEGMPFIARSSPPADVGLFYQAWFVDDDTSPFRYQSIRRFKPNALGDATLTGAINPGDGDGDGVPEPLDFERVLVSIEPDGLTAQQPEGQGVDTSGEIFPIVPYEAKLPDVHE